MEQDNTKKTTESSHGSSDLMTSAKTVAEAAQATANHQTGKVDKAKVAGASEDLLEAGKTYGKLDDKAGVGQYIDKAEGYLHQQAHPSDAPKTTTPEAAETGGEKGEKKDEKSSSGGGGGIMNMAKGLFNK